MQKEKLPYRQGVFCFLVLYISEKGYHLNKTGTRHSTLWYFAHFSGDVANQPQKLNSDSNLTAQKNFNIFISHDRRIKNGS